MQVSDPAWELYCLEHDIQPDGQMSASSGSMFSFNDRIFFDIIPTKYVPRATLNLLEPLVFDKVQSSMCTVLLCVLGHIHFGSIAPT
jgi:tubulin alpha